jgi:hypothetical protein
MELIDAASFFGEYPEQMFYAGFLKSAETWFPMCFVSDPDGERRLDTLFLSPSYQVMAEMTQDCAKQVPQLEQTFVHYLTQEEIENLLDRYGLRKIALVAANGGSVGCDCGCGCS